MKMDSKNSDVVSIYDKKQDQTIKYYLDRGLKRNLNKIKKDLVKKDRDYFLAIDGNEGSGKSTLALQIGKYVDPTLNLSRVVFDAESFREVIFKAKKGEVVVFDEAFTGLSSRASLSGINRALVSLMMQMRQKNLFVIMVLPTFFLLDKYVALFRARALIHVYETKGKDGSKNRGYFKVYNQLKKKYLYLAGKPTYSYSGSKWKIRTKFRGRFYGVFALGDSKMDEKYRKKKAKALESTEKAPMSAGQIKYREQRDVILYILRKTSKMTYEQLSNLLGDYDFDVSIAQIGQICSKFGDKNKLVEKATIYNDNDINNDVNGLYHDKKLLDDDYFNDIND